MITAACAGVDWCYVVESVILSIYIETHSDNTKLFNFTWFSILLINNSHVEKNLFVIRFYAAVKKLDSVTTSGIVC